MLAFDFINRDLVILRHELKVIREVLGFIDSCELLYVRFIDFTCKSQCFHS